MAEAVAIWLAHTSVTVLPVGVATGVSLTSDLATRTLASTTADASTYSKTTSACKLSQ